MSGFLNFACGAARSRSPRGILRVAALNPCATRKILPHILSARAARDEALRSFANLSLKQNFGFEILKQGLKFISALAFFGRNYFFKICARFKFKDGSQKRSSLAFPTAAITVASASLSATLPTTLPVLAALPVSARAQAKFKSAEFKSAIFKFAAFQSTLAKRAIFKFTKFTIFSLAALKFKNSPLAQRRALV